MQVAGIHITHNDVKSNMTSELLMHKARHARAHEASDEVLHWREPVYIVTLFLKRMKRINRKIGTQIGRCLAFLCSHSVEVFLIFQKKYQTFFYDHQSRSNWSLRDDERDSSCGSEGVNGPVHSK